MNLLQLRTKFRQVSGRADLVNVDFTDNGADFYINEGRKFLDRLIETQKTIASCFRFVPIDGFSAQFPHCRAIKEVWATSTSARWRLEKMNLSDLIADYLTGLPSSRTAGLPLYYAPATTRYIPEDAGADDFEAFIGFVDIPEGNAHEYNSVLLNVPVEEKLSLEIKGLYYSMELVEETDENYWSVVHPLLLITATMRYLEVINRNTQGVNDWTASITTEMNQIGFDLVEELIADADEMEG